MRLLAMRRAHRVRGGLIERRVRVVRSSASTWVCAREWLRVRKKIEGDHFLDRMSGRSTVVRRARRTAHGSRAVFLKRSAHATFARSDSMSISLRNRNGDKRAIAFGVPQHLRHAAEIASAISRNAFHSHRDQRVAICLRALSRTLCDTTTADQRTSCAAILAAASAVTSNPEPYVRPADRNALFSCVWANRSDLLVLPEQVFRVSDRFARVTSRRRS
jgi:hypothetical protein